MCALDASRSISPAAASVGLIGPDGVGKSSLLGIIAGARRIQAGQVRRAGRRHGGCAPSRTSLLRASPTCRRGSARTSIPTSASARTSSSSAACSDSPAHEREWRIAELLDSTGLAPFADRPAKKLSGGMRQKLGLCCALIHDPDLLILDEPTTGVDPLSRRQFWELIDRHARAPPGHERHRRDRLHGGSRAVRLADRHERRQRCWPPGSPADLKAETGTSNDRGCLHRAAAGRAAAGDAALSQIPPRAGCSTTSR